MSRILNDQLQRLRDEKRAIAHRLTSSSLTDADRSALLIQAEDFDRQIAEYEGLLRKSARGEPEDALRKEIELLSARVATNELMLRGHSALPDAPGVLGAVRDLTVETRALASRVRNLTILIIAIIAVFVTSMVWNVWLVSRILG